MDVEITWEDGMVARWHLPNLSPLEENELTDKIEKLLGRPDTLKA